MNNKTIMASDTTAFQSKEKLEKDDFNIIVVCPHCKHLVLTTKKDIRCSIYRHAIFKNNYRQISPHTGENECNELLREKRIIGCAKPFKIVYVPDDTHNDESKKYKAEICGYI